MQTIAIVEDDVFLREELENILAKEGYEVFCIASFTEVEKQLITTAPDLVLLDLTLPASSGFEICRNLKNLGLGPVLVLTARDQLRDELHALSLGADDYLLKPCPPAKLVAKVQKLLELYTLRAVLLDGGGFKLDGNSYILFVGNETCRLPETEGKILKILIEAHHRPVKKDVIFDALWGGRDYVDENILQVNIARLRKSLEKMGLAGRIETVRGIGYCLTKGERP